MGIKVANNAFATLASGISNSATSITLTTGQGARFPSLGAGDYFYATLVDTSNNLEIVKCTARSTDVLTVVRAQESTTARAYSAGDRIEIRLTAATFTDATQALPTQTGNAGKYLTTNGTDASWATVSVTPTAVSDQTNSSTGYFDLPAGTTAQRPGSPGSGMVRFNTTLGEPEWYDPASAQWLRFWQGANYNVEYLVIAGGGGGGGVVSGGGGAGGYRSSVAGESSGGGASAESALVVTPGTSYTVTIGAGGAGGIGYDNGAPERGAQGSNSVFASITSVGGGAGGGSYSASGAFGGSGGSGGGAGAQSTGTAVGGSPTSGQGYVGGSGNGTNTGGGGGGAGAVGQNATTTAAGNGGNGVASNITGSSVTRAGGGGGGGRTNVGPWPAGSGGTGGGGAGSQSSTLATAGTANTGGGGGGAGYSVNSSSTLGGAGGSGIVIIRYTGSPRGSGGTITQAGGYTIHTFTSSGNFIA